MGGKKRTLYGATRIGISWHRYYDPSTGRYLTPDPIGLDGGINLYSYSFQNPVNYIDPFGLNPGDIFKTRRDAAVDAIRYIQTTKNNWREVEYGGWVYKADDCEEGYTYREPIEGVSGGVPGFPPVMPEGAANAWFHTHNEPSGLQKLFGTDGESFSFPDDISISRYNKSDGYVGTPSGHIKKYDPTHKEKGWKHGVSSVDWVLRPNH